MKFAGPVLLAIALCPGGPLERLGKAAQPETSRDAAGGFQGLKDDLQALRKGAPATPDLARQMGTHMLLMAEKSDEPSAATLRQFCETLAGSLSGRVMGPSEIEGLATDIRQTLESAGTSTIAFQDTIRDFEWRLRRVSVAAARAHLAASLLERVGREVRGPEDTPVMKFPRRQ